MNDDSDPIDPNSPAAIEQEIVRTRARLESTLEAIEDRLSPDYLMERAMSYLREEAADWGVEIGAFVRRNPLPVALVGLGLGWIAVSVLRGDVRDIEYDAEPEDPRPSRRGNGPYTPSDYGVESVRRRASSLIETARDEVVDRAGEVGDRLGDYAGEARGRFEDFTEGARDFADDALDFAEGTRERLAHVASDVSERVSDSVSRLQHEVVRAAEERPLMLGAIGLGIGALIGLCLPGTRAEARLIGARRDELVEDVREAGKERLDDVVDAVRHAGAAFRDQAEEEGLSRRGLSQTMDKAQRVAETALDTAKADAEAALSKHKDDGESSNARTAHRPAAGGEDGKPAAKPKP